MHPGVEGGLGGGRSGKAVRAEFIHGIHLQFNGPGSNVERRLSAI